MLRRPITSLLLCTTVLLLLLSLATAHKSSSEAGTTDIEYNIGLGLVPAQIVEGEEQKFYLRVEKYGDFTPISNLRTLFIIYRDISADLDSSEQLYQRKLGETVGKYEAVEDEEEPGYYVAEHTFDRGNYIIEATLYDGRNVITQQTRNVLVEPRAPSAAFWLIMAASLIAGALFATRSHKVL